MSQGTSVALISNGPGPQAMQPDCLFKVAQYRAACDGVDPCQWNNLSKQALCESDINHQVVSDLFEFSFQCIHISGLRNVQ